MTEDDEVLLLIEQELRPLLRGKREVSPDSQIMADLGLDSLAVMDFIMVLEERFDIVIPVDALAEVRTVRDLARTVAEIRARVPAGTAA